MSNLFFTQVFVDVYATVYSARSGVPIFAGFLDSSRKYLKTLLLHFSGEADVDATCDDTGNADIAGVFDLSIPF